MDKITDLGKIGITPGGEYDNKVIYEKLTIVLYKGKSYISTKTTQGVSPEQDNKIWQLVAEAKDAYHMLVDAGKTTLTEEEFLEQLVDATKGRYIVQGNIINAADEEDLTVEHSDILGIDTLKLANRPSTDCMGYIILRKNKSFAEQVTKENTIYEIRYEFILEGNINIPANCILKFNGGSIYSKYTITGTNTIINAGLIKIFNTDITLSGTWNVAEAYPEWFGAKGDSVTDDILPIQKCLDTFKICKLSAKSYNISNTIVIDHSYILTGVFNSEIRTSQNICILHITGGKFRINNIRLISTASVYSSSVIIYDRTSTTPTNINEGNKPSIENVSISTFGSAGDLDFNSAAIEFKDLNKIGLYDVFVNNIRVIYTSTAVKLNAGNGYINGNRFGNIFAFACKTAIKMVCGGTNDMIMSNIIDIEFQNDINYTYNNPPKVVDISNYELASKNIINVTPWDVFVNPLEGKGSVLGCVEHNVEMINRKEIYIDNENDAFLCAMQRPSGSYIASAAYIRLINQYIEINLHLTFDGSVVNCRRMEYTNTRPNIVLKYITVDDIAYVFIGATSTIGYIYTSLVCGSRVLFNDTGACEHKGLFGNEASNVPIEYSIKLIDLPKGSRTDRPGSSMREQGTVYFDTTIKRPVWWDGDKWLDFNYPKDGILSSLTENEKGVRYYTDANRPAYWQGFQWFDSDGFRSMDLNGLRLQKKGPTTLRQSYNLPDSEQYNGFCFFDQDLKKPVWWNGTAWVDATGTPV